MLTDNLWSSSGRAELETAELKPGLHAFDRRMLAAALVLAIGYYAGVQVGIALTFAPNPVSTLWPPNAILLAALLLTPPRAWWLMIAAVLPAHLVAELSLGVPLTMAACWFVSNVSEALLGAVVLVRLLNGPPRFERVRDLSVFLVVAVLLAPVASSFLDAGFVSLVGWSYSGDYWQVWRTRLFSNALATLTLVPLIVIWFQRGIRAAAAGQGGRVCRDLCAARRTVRGFGAGVSENPCAQRGRGAHVCAAAISGLGGSSARRQRRQSLRCNSGDVRRRRRSRRAGALCIERARKRRAERAALSGHRGILTDAARGFAGGTSAREIRCATAEGKPPSCAQRRTDGDLGLGHRAGPYQLASGAGRERRQRGSRLIPITGRHAGQDPPGRSRQSQARHRRRVRRAAPPARSNIVFYPTTDASGGLRPKARCCWTQEASRCA